MQITYHGHSTFKLKGKKGTLITDPFDDYVGMVLPKTSADIVTVSHDHKDHNAVSKITATTRREKPFIIDKAGEYEVGGISVFGIESFHDNSQGAERGKNFIFTALIDGVSVCHLGDLGHELTTAQLEAIGTVDVLLCPVGGLFTIDPETAVNTIKAIEPSIVIPMHYRTDFHNPDVFSGMKTLNDFVKEYGMNPTPVAKLDVGDEVKQMEETELVILSSVQ